MVVCLERGANDLHMVQLMPLQPVISCFSKIQNGVSFWYRPTQVVLEIKAVKWWYVCMVVSSVYVLAGLLENDVITVAAVQLVCEICITSDRKVN